MLSRAAGAGCAKRLTTPGLKKKEPLCALRAEGRSLKTQGSCVPPRKVTRVAVILPLIRGWSRHGLALGHRRTVWRRSRVDRHRRRTATSGEELNRAGREIRCGAQPVPVSPATNCNPFVTRNDMSDRRVLFARTPVLVMGSHSDA